MWRPKRTGFNALVILSLSLLGSLLASGKANASCESLAFERFGEPDFPTLITSAETVGASDSLPAYCKVEGYIAPQIGFELRLPTQGWNEKFLMQGCGGLCGIIKIQSADDALARGYAVTNTDLGHKGQPFSGIWAYNNRPAEEDFGYRATHAVANVTKSIVRKYYEQPPTFSYFRGCSTGGRQGMVEAQRYPEDFDGIISGAPVLNETGVGALHLIWSVRANLDENDTAILDGAKLSFVHQKVLEKCDALDGVSDGLLTDPRNCEFKPQDLLCTKDSATEQCLTPDEAQVIQRIYDGPVNSVGQSLYTGGLMRGSEYEWAPGLVGIGGKPALALQMPMLNDFVAFMAFDRDPGPGFTMMDFDFDRDPPRLQKMEAIYTASEPDLSAFQERGGKIIMYHGWDDLEVPPLSTVEYYDQVAERAGGIKATQDFYRLFMLPGVAHCRRGPGPDAVDYLSYLEDWVENDRAPNSMMASHLKVEQSYDGLPPIRFPLLQSSIEYARPIYPYPDTPQYIGEGEVSDPASWRSSAGSPQLAD